jgi:hypothetical protein
MIFHVWKRRSMKTRASPIFELLVFLFFAPSRQLVTIKITKRERKSAPGEKRATAEYVPF